MSDYQMVRASFKEHGVSLVNYKVPSSNPSIRDRINLTNARLKTASGKIGLLVDPKCTELIRDFEQVSYKAGSTQVDKDRDRMRTHASDALGYLLWEECMGARKIGYRQERVL
jgi:hypothetical protein